MIDFIKPLAKTFIFVGIFLSIIAMVMGFKNISIFDILREIENTDIIQIPVDTIVNHINAWQWLNGTNILNLILNGILDGFKQISTTITIMICETINAILYIAQVLIIVLKYVFIDTSIYELI